MKLRDITMCMVLALHAASLSFIPGILNSTGAPSITERTVTPEPGFNTNQKYMYTTMFIPNYLQLIRLENNLSVQ